MKLLQWTLPILLSLLCNILPLQNAQAESNIFAQLDPTLQGPHFDSAVEAIVLDALNHGTPVIDIVSMATDNSLKNTGLNKKELIVSTLTALYKLIKANTEAIDIAAQERRIPVDYVNLARIKNGLPPIPPAPGSPGDSGVHPPPEPVASPSRP